MLRALCLFIFFAPGLAAAESIRLNTGFGVLACGIKNEKYSCAMPAQFAQSIEILLTKAPGSDFATGSREFSQVKNGHTFKGTLFVTKYTVQYATFYSLAIYMDSEAKKRQSLGSISFPDPGKLNVAYWYGAELQDGDMYLIPVLAAAAPTESLAPLREEILLRGLKK